MAIDWSKTNELESLKNEVKKDDVDSTSLDTPSPASPKQGVEVPDYHIIPKPEDPESVVKVKQGLNKYMDALYHTVTSPIDTLLGLGETGVEMVTGLAGASVGAISGLSGAITEATRDEFNALMEDFGFESSVVLPDKPEEPGQAYLSIFNEVAPAFTYGPRTESGKAISGFIHDIFTKFGSWGKDAGSWAMENDLGPGVATALETLIAGTPYIVPPLVAKGTANIRPKSKRVADKIRVDRIEELSSEGKLEIIPELEFTVIPDTMKPSTVLDIIKDKNLKLSHKPEELASIAKKMQEDKFDTPIIMQKNKAGSLELVDKADADIIRLAKELGDKDLNIRVIETTRLAKDDARASGIIDENAKKVEENYKKQRAELDELEAKMKKSIIGKIKTGVLDVSAEVKGRLLKQAGDAGEKSVMMHDLIAGASPKGHLRFQKWDDKIYLGLDRNSVSDLNQVIQSRRIIQIDKLKGEGKVKHPGNLTGTKHQHALIAMKERLGPEKFKELWDKSNEYFSATNEVLVDLYAEGMLTKKQFNEMRELVYEPRKFINRLDPVHKQKLGNQSINVHDSGLAELKRGSVRTLEQDSRALLAEYIIRAENRIARNKANKALLDFAKLYPDNGWVKALDVAEHTKTGKAKNVHIPQGHVRVDTIVDGKQQPMLMDAAMAEQWITQSPQMTHGMANLMRVMSGSFVVRPLATGYNPGFALVNLPRDITHAYLATSEYSNHLPVYAAQMGLDLVSVAKDAWKKQGKFEDYINEGGGMNFLTHQGTDIIARGSTKEVSPRWRKIKEGISKVNEFSEIWVRLAIRERALKNGKTPEQATWEARNYLDFSQGGKYAKSVDHAIPYLNASIQAFRTTARQAKKDPVAFGVKMAWLNTAASSLWLSNQMINPEGWSQVSSDERRQNWVIMTPMSFIDQNGNERHLYFKIKKDNFMIPFVSPVEMLLERYHEGRIPDKEFLKSLRDMSPVVPVDAVPPSISAMMTYTSNHDFWTDEQIWRGPAVKPEEEFSIGPDKPTSIFYRDVGQWTGLSPSRTEASVRKLFPQNPYTDLVGSGYKALMEGQTAYDRSRTTLQMLNDTPILRRIIGLTHPAAREMVEVESGEAEGETYRHDLSRKIDNLYFRSKQGELDGGISTVRRWIAAQPPEERVRLTKRLETQQAYDRIMSRYTGLQGVPSRLWWVRTGGLDAVTRADIYYWEWRGQSQKGRQLMESLAGRLNSSGLGYRSDHFNRRLHQLRKEFGTDYYGEGEARESNYEIPRR